MHSTHPHPQWKSLPTVEFHWNECNRSGRATRSGHEPYWSICTPYNLTYGSKLGSSLKIVSVYLLNEHLFHENWKHLSLLTVTGKSILIMNSTIMRNTIYDFSNDIYIFLPYSFIYPLIWDYGRVNFSCFFGQLFREIIATYHSFGTWKYLRAWGFLLGLGWNLVLGNYKQLYKSKQGRKRA